MAHCEARPLHRRQVGRGSGSVSSLLLSLLQCPHTLQSIFSSRVAEQGHSTPTCITRALPGFS